MTEETKAKISASVKRYRENNPEACLRQSQIMKKKYAKNSPRKGVKLKKSTREKISLSMINQYLNGERVMDGRGYKSYYKNQLMDSNWEREFAERLDKFNIRWQKATRYYPYYFGGIQRHYLPDFYVKGVGYVEIKGFTGSKGSRTYQSKARNEKKWDAFPYSLVVLLGREFEEFLKVQTKDQAVKFLKERAWNGKSRVCLREGIGRYI